MFQYAFAKAVEQKTGMKAFFDMSFFEKSYSRPFELGVFGIDPDRVSAWFDKFRIAVLWKLRRKMNNKSFCGLRLCSEPHFEYYDFDIKPEDYVIGFFQTEKYFDDAKFDFKQALDGKNKEVADLINDSNSISLHIRRGDYVQKKRYQNVYATCSLDYYRRAVELITKGNPDFKLFIFSDDISWVKENLKLPYETVYVDFNSGKDSYKDMQLMSLCKHNVIANSSFSWWGAYLNKNPQKVVVAPCKWFNDEKINQNDIIPQSWVRIDN